MTPRHCWWESCGSAEINSSCQWYSGSVRDCMTPKSPERKRKVWGRISQLPAFPDISKLVTLTVQLMERSGDSLDLFVHGVFGWDLLPNFLSSLQAKLDPLSLANRLWSMLATEWLTSQRSWEMVPGVLCTSYRNPQTTNRFLSMWNSKLYFPN